MAPSVASFRPSAPLTWQELDDLATELPVEPLVSSDDTTDPGDGTTPGDTTGTIAPTTPTTTTTDTTTTTETTTTIPDSADPSDPVTLSQFDAVLVDTLGLSGAATRFRDTVRQAGLNPPKRFGTETVARLLGLRTNHPARQDKLELLPGKPITRAEAAYSIAQTLSFNGDELQWVDDVSFEFTLPGFNGWQKRILNYAVGFVGYPYIWGGTSPKKQYLFGRYVPGGFDCSGLVWRVYKLRQYSGGKRLSKVLRGRTTYRMSGEVKRSKRIAFGSLQPGDVIFFGLRGWRSKPNQVNHMAIYLGDNWFVQSSGNGVDVVPLEGWYRSRFAWGRRPLAEAGLVNVYAVSGS
jgi:cell wall-associated NlpC family hydrolase